jgi:di/tricarboxylate transporter
VRPGHPLQGFEKTGLGERIANLFVRAMGKSTLGLAFGLNVAEALLAPAMPSTSARAGQCACCCTCGANQTEERG